VRKPLSVPVVVSLALALVACATAGRESSGPRADRGYRAVVSRADIAGAPIGDDPAARATVVIVFASWCRPCRNELNMLSELIREQPKIRIIGVNAYEDWDNLSDEKKLHAFLAETHPWLRVVRGDDEILSSLGGVPKIPSVFVFDRNGGKVKAYRRAERKPPTRQELEAVLAPLTS
jgi:thiol-disulfide isomerase/thioredoxin